MLLKGKSTLKSLKSKPFAKERDMQNMVEGSLSEIFRLEFVISEFAPRGDLRIDTLAYDSEQKSITIIEYKKGHSWSVIDQGYAYLSLMLNNKADFVLKINKCLKKNWQPEDINWEASRVIFVSPSFNTYQREALGFQDHPFELWEIYKYENDLILLNKLEVSSRGAKLSDINMGSAEAKKVQSEVKTYTLSDFFHNKEDDPRIEYFDKFVTALQDIDSRITVQPRKSYVGLQIDGWNICAVNKIRGGFALHFPRCQPKDVKDPEKRLKYLKTMSDNKGTHVSELKVSEDDDVSYASMITRQVIERFDK